MRFDMELLVILSLTSLVALSIPSWADDTKGTGANSAESNSSANNPSNNATTLTGPLATERQTIHDLILQAGQKGKNVTNYTAAAQYIEDRVRAGASAAELDRTVTHLITQLDEEIHDVKHAPIVIQQGSSTSSQTKTNNGDNKNNNSGKSAAQEYSDELKKIHHQQESEHKKQMSKEFWQKFHDEGHKPKS